MTFTARLTRSALPELIELTPETAEPVDAVADTVAVLAVPVGATQTALDGQVDELAKVRRVRAVGVAADPQASRRLTRRVAARAEVTFHGRFGPAGTQLAAQLHAGAEGRYLLVVSGTHLVPAR